MKRSFKIRIFLQLGLILLLSCEKEKEGLPTDADGNTYDTVVIGTQTWLADNLKTTKYINGDPIPLVTDNVAWEGFNRGAYCWYENNINFKDVYGALYNGYAARLSDFVCPIGYHIATKDDWSVLINNLKDTPEEIKQSFNSKQLGWRTAGGGFFRDCCSRWWTSSPYNDYEDKITHTVTYVFEFTSMDNHGGYFIRCVKDQ